eukprot:TRINITY_DN3122_c0_g2_i2.p1 TRINITY_DN3122_c0_g2~~TRINITY_DN3122_c0_g2_i2.p1  ORF type:complete len:197 (-),score=26.77 TRINITY_DN3122_c0_g2_i2:253-843(-)
MGRYEELARKNEHIQKELAKANELISTLTNNLKDARAELELIKSSSQAINANNEQKQVKDMQEQLAMAKQKHKEDLYAVTKEYELKYAKEREEHMLQMQELKDLLESEAEFKLLALKEDCVKQACIPKDSNYAKQLEDEIVKLEKRNRELSESLHKALAEPSTSLFRNEPLRVDNSPQLEYHTQLELLEVIFVPHK